MKKMLAVAVVAVIGGSCLCGNAVPAGEETYCEDGIMPLAATDVIVNYEDKSDNEYKMVLKHPDYTASNHIAACACIAGSNVIGFYDRYDENLIPNHKSGTVFQGQFLYGMQDTYIYELADQLYTDMGTDNEGTTVTQFKNGMMTFCDRKGKGISFSSCMRGGRFDYSLAKSYMEANQPVVLFCSGYNVAAIWTNDNYDDIAYYESTANHVMVGFGYMEVNYTLSSASSALYQYVKVASGTNSRPNGYYDINYNTKINDAYAINIY